MKSSKQLSAKEPTRKVRYAVDESKRKRFPEPLFSTIVSHRVNSDEVEKFIKRNGRLPEHVYVVEDTDHDE